MIIEQVGKPVQSNPVILVPKHRPTVGAFDDSLDGRVDRVTKPFGSAFAALFRVPSTGTQILGASQAVKEHLGFADAVDHGSSLSWDQGTASASPRSNSSNLLSSSVAHASSSMASACGERLSRSP